MTLRRLSLAQSSEPVLLATVWTQPESLELCAVLRAEGLSVDAVDLNRSGLIGYGTGTASMGIEIYVPRHQLEEAKTHLSADAPVEAGVYDASSGLARCPQHHRAFDVPCTRCGNFLCAGCAQGIGLGPGRGLCDACESRQALPGSLGERRSHFKLKWIVRVSLFAFIGLTVLGGVVTLLAELVRHFSP